MKKVRSWRERRDEWFRTMFAKLFAEWHEVREEKKSGMWGYTLLCYGLTAKKAPLAKHPDYDALEKRLKVVEQRTCDHQFACPKKGCLESIVCSKCGALDPAWQKAPPKRWDDNDNVVEGYIEPEVFHDGVGYIRAEDK